MQQRRFIGLFALLVLALVLVACGGEAQEVIEEVAPTLEAAATELAPTIEAAATKVAEQVEEAGEEEAEAGGLPDLGGREVTVAIENQYLPFNYIDPNSGEPTGWDYEAWDAICELLNCVPVYIEAGW
jgi:polar amino acid transport system substrate-binding protein